jgi:hypothetical protein
MDDKAKKRRLANLRPFKPGQSGNPGGRSKAQIDVRNAARDYTLEAIDTMVLVMRNGKPSEAAMAANGLLDRGWGKPQRQVEADPRVNTPREMSREEILLKLEEIRALSVNVPSCDNDCRR